jgi:hypothetical protein
MSKESIVSNLISGIEFDDTRLHDLLELLSSDVYAVYNNVFPPTTITLGGFTGQFIGPSSVLDFTYNIYNDNLHLSWTGLNPLFSYEIRYKFGAWDESAWDGATVVLTTNTTAADINPKTIPLTTGNTHTFLIKAIDTNGTYSTFPSFLNVVIPVFTNPIISATPLQNTVLISWTVPASTWSIVRYNLYKNNALLATVTGTFYANVEQASGVYQYSIEAVDIVGDVSVRSGNVTVTVQNPIDFALLDQRGPLSIYPIIEVANSNYAVEDSRASWPQNDWLTNTKFIRIAIPTVGESFQHHFDYYGLTSPQDQINAGYSYWLQPGFNGAYGYRWDFDFGIVVNNASITVKYTLAAIAGVLDTSQSGISWSTDNVNWSPVTVGPQGSAPAARYVRFYLRGTSAYINLDYIYNITCLLSLVRLTDSGTVSALAADTNGTVVMLNEAFTSIQSIQLTPQTNLSVFPVLNFGGGFYPTSFRVLVYDNAGIRINCPVHWLARGFK